MEVVPSEFVVARCDAPEVLEPAVAALDDVAILIGLLVVTYAFLPILSAWDHRFDAVLAQRLAERVAVISLVTEQLGDAVEQTDTCRPIFRRTIDPSTSALEHMHDPAQNAPIVLRLHATAIPWNKHINPRRLHGSKPQHIRPHLLAPRFG